jgi:hypothetical protein
MEPSEYGSTTALEILATSVVMRLSVAELDWLWGELARRTEEKRCAASGEGAETFVLAGYRDAWEPMRPPLQAAMGLVSRIHTSRTLSESLPRSDRPRSATPPSL